MYPVRGGLSVLRAKCRGPNADVVDLRTMELDPAGFNETNSLMVTKVKPAAFCWPSSCEEMLEISDDEEES
jgi:hypothetical protein